MRRLRSCTSAWTVAGGTSWPRPTCSNCWTTSGDSLALRWAMAGLAGDFKAAQSSAGLRISSTCKGRFLKAVVINSGEKKAMPHKPTMPATPRQMPTKRAAAPARMAEQVRNRADGFAGAAGGGFRLGPYPGLGFLQDQQHRHRQDGGENAHEGQHLPAAVMAPEVFQAGGDLQAKPGGQHVAARRQRLHRAQRQRCGNAAARSPPPASSPRRTSRPPPGRTGNGRPGTRPPCAQSRTARRRCV